MATAGPQHSRAAEGSAAHQDYPGRFPEESHYTTTIKKGARIIDRSRLRVRFPPVPRHARDRDARMSVPNPNLHSKAFPPRPGGAPMRRDHCPLANSSNPRIINRGASLETVQVDVARACVPCNTDQHEVGLERRRVCAEAGGQARYEAVFAAPGPRAACNVLAAASLQRFSERECVPFRVWS